jgi:hypothetical protein
MTPMIESHIELDGFDPLQESFSVITSEDPNKPVVLNVLNSYTGFFDLFSELVQNALDAVQVRVRTLEVGYQPHIWIKIDMKGRMVRVADNGVGMDLQQFKYCFRPNVTFKRGAGLRGNKGVGATYLAYGFSMVRIQAKKDGTSLAAILRNGRRWAEDSSGVVPRPKLEVKTFDVPELIGETSGACFEIILGDSPGARPRDLGWIGARNAEQWFQVLRIKTPLGAVNLHTTPFKPKITVQVFDTDGNSTSISSDNVEYFYPHEFGGKVASLTDLRKSLEKIPGDATTKFAKLPNEFKKLDCMYEIWDRDQILDEKSDLASALDPEELILVERHKVSIYGSFLSSSKQWNDFNDNTVGLRKGQKIIYGGLQLACDGMVQGDPLVIPLTSTIGYQANAHIIVHMSEGNPDMGRKVFQPELKRLAEKLAVRVVTIFKRYLQHRRPEAGPPNVSAGLALHQWKKAQDAHRDRKPLSLELNGRSLALISEPQQEQDVIALFHELLGMDVLKGYKILATSQSETYDSLYELHYPDNLDFRFDRQCRPIGVADRYVGESTEPRVLEYKYDFDGLLDDLEQEVKSQSHIHLVICWTASSRYRDKYYFKSLLVNEEGSERFHFGATHQAFADSSSEWAFEVIVLKDLLNYLTDRESEEARQKQVYKDD